MDNDFSSFVMLSEDMTSALRQLQLADVEEQIEEPAADEARQVLRWIGNLPSAEMPLDEWLDSGTPEEALAKATSLSQLVKIFIRKLRRARKKRPDILRAEALVENAAHAAAALTHAVIEFTLSKLPAKHPKAASLEASLNTLLPEAGMRQAQSVNRVVEIVATGMERASGKNVSGKSVPERLVEINARMQATGRRLRSVDSMEPPAREESIELAREILRRLKNLKFSDRPLKQMIDTGDLNDKIAFAEQIEEVTDIYKNLVQEAAEINPNILQDQCVKDANTVVQTFAHGVKLMAAKEMPNSIASAQQISADDTQNPEAWDTLHNRTVERLVKSMEGGLEKAANDIQNEQEQQNDQQAQEAAMEAAQHHADQARRKKRKRRGGGRSSAIEAGKKQAKQAAKSDAKVAKEVAMVNIVHGLNAEAMAAVKQLGGALLKVNNQAKDLNTTLATVTSTDKITPDDKTITQRVIEEEVRKGPRNQGGPGV